jgi:hypothetical protein
MTDTVLENFTVILDPGSDYDDTEIDELTRRFKSDLFDQAEVVAIDSRVGAITDGVAKGVTAEALNAVDVTAHPGLLAGLIGLVRNWVNGGEDRRVELAFPQADRSVIIKALPNDLPVVLKALAEYEQLRPRIRYAPGADSLGANSASPIASRSGGADLTADTLAVGDDVVGRDKIMSAGGHIIIAQEGATVIFNDPSVEAPPAASA